MIRSGWGEIGQIGSLWISRFCYILEHIPQGEQPASRRWLAACHAWLDHKGKLELRPSCLFLIIKTDCFDMC